MKISLPIYPKVIPFALALVLIFDAAVLGATAVMLYDAAGRIRVIEVDGRTCILTSARWFGSTYAVFRCETKQ